MLAAHRFAPLPLSIAILASAPAMAAANTVTAKDQTGAVTFYADVLPIIQENCQACHRPNGANLGGMVAPMAFTSYDETRPWAKAIAKKVAAREMPPWHASPDQHGVFANERTLNDAQINTLVAWAKAGAPAGDAADAPPPREFASSDGWMIGEPDLIVSMPDKYLVGDDVSDQYITFQTKITKEMLPEARWVRAVEFRPGSSVVHHIIAPPLGGIAPGNDPTIYREGYGTLLEPGATVSWQMHYHKEPGPGTAVYDQSKVALRFYPPGYEPTHIIQGASMGNLWFKVPAGDPNYSDSVSYTFERDAKILSFLPHMHLRGKAAKYVAYYPDGRQETLLEVPKYDFNWQTTYRFKEDKFVPAGTRIELTEWWDNSANNPYNPDPTVDVSFGQPTTAEMMFGFMNFTDAVDGYVPAYRGGLLGGRDEERAADQQKIDPREMIHRRLGIDLDSLCPDDKQRLMKAFMSGNGFPHHEGEESTDSGAGTGGQ